MADLNKVFLMGRLTFDPELRRTTSGMAVTDLRLATSRVWNGRDGERKEETLYIDVAVWDRQAETCCQYLKKGSGVHVEGSLKMDSWDDKTTGEKRTKIKVQAERVQFLERSNASGGGGGGGGAGMPEDEYGGAPVREAPARRPAPVLEPRGPGNGPARGFGGPGAGNAPRRPMPEPAPNQEDDEDIPF